MLHILWYSWKLIEEYLIEINLISYFESHKTWGKAEHCIFKHFKNMYRLYIEVKNRT